MRVELRESQRDLLSLLASKIVRKRNRVRELVQRAAVKEEGEVPGWSRVTERVRDGCGLRKERGKRAEADRERIERASKRTGSRRTWLQLVRCALVHTGVLFRKSRSNRKGNRGNRSRYSDWRYRRKHLSIYTNYVFHMEQVRRDREWKS